MQKDEKMKAYLLSMRVDDILATLHRQTMFAEFELKTHELVEKGVPLTAEVLRKTYRELLELYFGPDMVFEEFVGLDNEFSPEDYIIDEDYRIIVDKKQDYKILGVYKLERTNPNVLKHRIWIKVADSLEEFSHK